MNDTCKRLLLLLIPLFLLAGCRASYQFNGASIDYSRTRTISFRDFTNNAPLVYPQLAPMFNESLKDLFSRQTKLSQVRENGDVSFEGEITGYDITPMSIGDDAIAAETRLTITVNVRYHNKAQPDKDFERKFSAFRNFSNTRTLTQVQAEVSQEIVDELVETIFNQTMADW